MSEPVGLGTKIPMLAVSFLLSLLLWIAVQIIQPVNVRYQQLSVQTFNFDDMGGKYELGKVDRAWIQIEGPEDLLNTAVDDILNKGMVAVYVNLTNAHVGVDDYPLGLSYARHDLPYKVTLSQNTIPVQVDRLDSRSLPLAIEDTGQIPAEKGLILDSATAKPSVVKIIGGSSAVREVKRIRCILDLSQVTGATTLPATCEALNERNRPVDGVTVSPSQVTLAVAVAPAGQSRSVLVQPIIPTSAAVGFSVTDYRVEPSQIAVQGPPEILARLTTVHTKPVDIHSLRDSATFEVAVELPPGVKSYSVRTVRVTVTIEPNGTSTNAPAATSP